MIRLSDNQDWNALFAIFAVLALGLQLSLALTKFTNFQYNNQTYIINPHVVSQSNLILMCVH